MSNEMTTEEKLEKARLILDWLIGLKFTTTRQVSDAQAAALERCQRHQVFEGDGRPIAGLVAGHASATLDVIPADEAEEPADEE